MLLIILICIFFFSTPSLIRTRITTPKYGSYQLSISSACNDASAYGVCRKLKEYRKKVPEDVSVVGYDDVFYARMLEVPLTTIRQQVREMGREAVRLLLKQIREHERPESKVIFAPELVVRESTARIQPSR